jgi:sulfur carrier protein
MKIILNNNPEIIGADTITLQQLIEHKNFTFKMLVTKINGRLIKKEDRTITEINDGDNIAVIHMISGG